MSPRRCGAPIRGNPQFQAIPGTPRAWSGQSRIAPEPVGTQAVCRYTANPSTTLNEEHPALYSLVTRSLHHQNFLLLDAGPCPAGTVLHQP